jgi:hypothetical protein
MLAQAWAYSLFNFQTACRHCEERKRRPAVARLRELWRAWSPPKRARAKEEAIQRKCKQGLDCFARNDEHHLSHTSVSPQRVSLGLYEILSLKKTEGAGKGGRSIPPAVCVQQKKHAAVSTGDVDWLDLPCANGFNGCFVLSPVIGLCCHRCLADHPPQEVMPASRHQDHTTLPSARSAHSSGARLASIASRAQRP